MGIRSLALAVLLVLVTVAFAPIVAAETGVRWNGRPYTAEALPEELGPGPRVAVRAWAEWADAEGFRLDLSKDGRVLVITPRRGSQASRWLRTVEKVGARVDALLPRPPAREESAPEPPPEEPGEAGGVPEDPEEGPAGGTPPEDRRWHVEWTWGLAERSPDTETAVLFVVRDDADYLSILEKLAADHPYLAEWAKGARKLAGFVLELPLCGMCVERPSGVEEWNVRNEIAHRTAELLILRRFGPLPYWLVQGAAWYFEFEVRRSIYCFPYRLGFVAEVEHTSWDRALGARFADRDGSPLTMADLAALQRGRYDDAAAKVAWGAFSFLRDHHRDVLPELFEDLRRFRDAHDRAEHGDGTWERIAGYEIPRDKQYELLAARLGEGFLVDLTGYLGAMKSWRPRR